MNLRKGPAALAVVAAAVAVVAVMLLSGGSDDGDDAATSASEQTGAQAGGDGSNAQPSGGGQAPGAPGKQDSAGQDAGQGGGGSAGQGGGDAEQLPTIEIKGGEPVGGVQELEFDSGEQIRFAVASDASGEIHFHGYDLYRDVPAGGQVEVEAPADIEGVFEVELHDTGAQLAEVTVSP